jgi:hypothetical protein
MLIKTGVHTCSQQEAEITAQAASRNGWRVFRLPIGIASREAFFEGVRRTLPLDPLLHTNRSWDALSDSLWGGIDGLADKKIAVVWSDAYGLLKDAPGDFAIATNILIDVATSLSNADAATDKTKQILVLQGMTS